MVEPGSPAIQTTLGQLAKESSIRSWKTSGRNGLVKVMNRAKAEMTKVGVDLSHVVVRGYVTQAKFLYGLTAGEIERGLGLTPMETLEGGAYVYGLDCLPTFDEVDYRYSAAWPNGQPQTQTEYEALLDRRDAAYAGQTSEPTLYPPGGTHILQWQVNSKKGIPATLLQFVTASARFHRDKPYAPHNRDVNWGRIQRKA